MPWQLPAHSHIALSGFQVVYGADVVQSTTGHIVARRCVRASHHPGGSQRNGMHLRKERARECYITPLLSCFTEGIQSFHELQQIKHTEQTVYPKLQ